jgi:SAM-dependent methyltransferase
VTEAEAVLRAQRGLWERAYRERPVEHLPAASAFAREVAPMLPPSSHVLELGCGLGADAALFARMGHWVLATDFSRVALQQVGARYGADACLRIAQTDLRARLPFAGPCFDVAYARLSLHYFDDATTRAIFAEIARVLRPGGVLAFMCKSTDDPFYGRGKPIEVDMFALQGKVRHFFCEAYARSCLEAEFDVERLWHGFEPLPDEPSRVVRVVARRVAPSGERLGEGGFS